MLRISRGLAARMVEHALAEHPVEACGVVAGPVGSDTPQRLVRLRNAAQSRTFYEVASRDLYELYRDLSERAEDLVVIYHSHTSTAAYPSATDVRLAAEPGAHYVIIATGQLADSAAAGPGEDLGSGDGEGPDGWLRSYRIVDGEISEEPVELI